MKCKAEENGLKKVVITADVLGWPVGTIAWMDPKYCTSAETYNDDMTYYYYHTVGGNCEWVVEETEEMTYKAWGDMTSEEKGALLLAFHEGKTIQWSGPFSPEEWSDDSEPFKYTTFKYRTKPEEPKRGLR